MKHGRTMMSSFLFNVALILLATTASIQFSTQCFARYAQGTRIYQIFGFQARHCRCLGAHALGHLRLRQPGLAARGQDGV